MASSVTANFKSPQFEEEHTIFIGTHIGSLKSEYFFIFEIYFQNPIICIEIEPKNEKPFALVNITKNNKETSCKITALEFGDEEKSSILIGQSTNFVKILDIKSHSVNEIELKDKNVTGLAKSKDFLICGFENGSIDKFDQKSLDHSVLKAGDNINKLKSNPYNRNIFATGGKGRLNNLKIFDVTSDKQIFSSKNLPNDHLQLEVPIWDSDMGFLSENVIATCSRYGYLRVYDVRKQRRPVLMYSNDKDNALKFTTISTSGDNSIFTGGTMGELRMFDARNLKTFAHTYKGCTGSISNIAIDESRKFLISTSLDRFVRIHNIDNCSFVYQCYIKSKPTSVLVK